VSELSAGKPPEYKARLIKTIKVTASLIFGTVLNLLYFYVKFGVKEGITSVFTHNIYSTKRLKGMFEEPSPLKKKKKKKTLQQMHASANLHLFSILKFPHPFSSSETFSKSTDNETHWQIVT
jgi:hypothetical protein